MPSLLIVDDSRLMRTIPARMLDGTGLTIREAEDGVAALSACNLSMPDGILLDWNMPVMDGPTFLQLLRASAGGAVPKVIFCTTESDMDKIAHVLTLGADEFIMKPYDVDILRDKLTYVGLLVAEAA